MSTIEVEPTPNPDCLKFIPGLQFLKGPGQNYDNIAQTNGSPLAETLFAINGVVAVHIGQDFITITKDQGHDWTQLKTQILSTLFDFLASGRPVIIESEAQAGEENNNGDNDSEIIAQIQELIDLRIRPAIARDGGDVSFHGFSDGIVRLRLLGACSGCPSAEATLKYGIENLLKHYVPEIKAVEPV